VEFGLRPLHCPVRPARLSRRSIKTRRRALLRFASAVVAPWLAGAAYADAISLAAPGTAQPPSGEFVETPVGAGAFPADLSSLLNPFPSALQQLVEPSFHADASTPPSTTPALGPFGFLSATWKSQNLLGDIWGLRPALSKYGITLNITENAEVFGNVTGGVKQGFEPNGLTTATVQLDTQKSFGFSGGQFNVSGLQIWGGYLSQDNLRNLQRVTGIEADVSVRLWELWYQQKFGDKFDVKVGEQSLDQEFMVSPSATYFLNSMFGWPMLPSADLPAGGPDYPLAAFGVRGRTQVTDNVTVLAGLFNGSAIPRNSPNSQMSNPNGVSFPLDTGIFAIAELQFTVPGLGASAKVNDAYKIGAWYDSYNFPDQQYDTMGVPLASPLSNGIPANHSPNYSIYGLMDKVIWLAKGDSNRYATAFVRPMFTTLQDRNLISFSVNGGVTLHEPLPGRDNDTFGLGFGVAKVSNSASAYDWDLRFYDPTVYTPVRSAETFLEATYQVQVAPWWQIQPDLQYVINPGAGIVNRNNPTQRIKNELVVGLRTNITF
jgi:porin